MTTIPRALVGVSRQLAHAYLTLPWSTRKALTVGSGLVVRGDETDEQALFRHSRETGNLAALWDQVRAAQLKLGPGGQRSILPERNPFK